MVVARLLHSGATRSLAGLCAVCAISSLTACSESTNPTAPLKAAILKLVVFTTGVDYSPQGYTLEVDGVIAQRVNPNDTVVLALTPGNHEVSIGGFEFYCGSIGDSTWVVQLPPGEIVVHSIRVHCIDTAGTILFTSGRGISANNNVFRVSANGSSFPLPILVSDTSDHMVAISPDGLRMAISRHPPGGGGDWFIFLVEIATRQAQQVTFHPSQAIYPTWSPDGLSLAFCSSRGGHGEIYRVSVAPDSIGVATPVRLATTVESCRPDWSPDGTLIAFESRVGTALQVYTMRPDGADVTQVSSCNTACYAPRWSPDGTRLLVEARIPETPNAQLFLMNVDGTNLIRLTDVESRNEFGSWSPTGDRIVFSRRQTGPYHLFVMDVETRLRYRVTSDDERWDRYARWLE